MSDESEVLLFTYGTLMRGWPLHEKIMEPTGAKFLGEDYTEHANFEMRSNSVYPLVMRGGKHRIKGELYLIPEYLLEILDRIEAEYMREQIPLANSGLKANMYIYSGEPYTYGYYASGIVGITADVASWEKLVNPF